jgi:hypothetical protein
MRLFDDVREDIFAFMLEVSVLSPARASRRVA